MKNKNSQIKDISRKLSQSQKSEDSINSSDAIEMISHGSEFNINVSTPIGMTFASKAKFIGCHSSNLILLEVPDISKEKSELFFQEGFWMNVRAFSQKGEGATIKFRSQIMHILAGKVPMIVISIPSIMKIKQLRKEARYEVSLTGYVSINGKKIEAEVRDISKSGCRFFIGPLNKSFDIGEDATIDIVNTSIGKGQNILLSGRLHNAQSTRHYAKYGLKFDRDGEDNAKILLANMRFNGTKFVFKNK